MALRERVESIQTETTYGESVLETLLRKDYIPPEYQETVDNLIEYITSIRMRRHVMQYYCEQCGAVPPTMSCFRDNGVRIRLFAVDG